jgi:CRP-like cAMP-binding protein
MDKEVLMPSKTAIEEKKEYKAGDTIMDQGQIARGLYVLMEGTLDIIYNGVMVAEISGKGSFVGEIASVIGGRRVAKVVARTPVKMLYTKNVTEYFETNPSAAHMMAKTLASRIMEMNKKLEAYEKIVGNWVKAGEDAIQKNDLAPIKDALTEIKEFCVRQIGAG